MTQVVGWRRRGHQLRPDATPLPTRYLPILRIRRDLFFHRAGLPAVLSLRKTCASMQPLQRDRWSTQDNRSCDSASSAASRINACRRTRSQLATTTRIEAGDHAPRRRTCRTRSRSADDIAAPIGGRGGWGRGTNAIGPPAPAATLCPRSLAFAVMPGAESNATGRMAKLRKSESGAMTRGTSPSTSTWQIEIGPETAGRRADWPRAQRLCGFHNGDEPRSRVVGSFEPHVRAAGRPRPRAGGRASYCRWPRAPGAACASLTRRANCRIGSASCAARRVHARPYSMSRSAMFI